MIEPLIWRVDAKLAWRDIRSSPAKSAFIVIAMAVSSASISGVTGAAGVVRSALRGSARAWLAADISVNTKEWLDSQQSAALKEMRSRGIDWTVATSTLSMAASDHSPDAGFISVKAVDPAVYPFYGAIDLDPPRTLAAALDQGTVIVSADALARLEVRVGDSIRVGGQPFHIAAVIQAEPDRFAGAPSVGMRCILSREGYIRSGIARGGNSELHRILFRLPANSDLESVRRQLQELFPGGAVLDYREENRQALWTVETAISSLGVTAFIALALGAAGVALAIREHIEQRMQTIAVMKMVGARGAQIGRVFLIEIAGLMVAALLVSVPLGWTVKLAALSFAARFVPLSSVTTWNYGAVLESAAAGLIAAAPALAQPALVIRRLRPAIILRRDSGEKAPARRTAIGGVITGVACAALAVTAARMLGSWDSASILVASLAASVCLASLVTAVALRLLRRWIAAGAGSRLPALRFGLASLYRPANRSLILIVALATALMTMIGTFESNRSIARYLVEALPFDEANLFVANFDNSHRESMIRFLGAQPGVQNVEMVTLARLRLSAVNGKPLDQLDGGVWLVGCAPGAPGLMIADDVARRLGVNIGSAVEFAGRDKSLTTGVVAIRKMAPIEKVWFSFKVDCPALAGQNLFHHAALRVAADRLASVRGAVTRRYPTLPVITGQELAATALEVIGEAVALVRVVAWYRIAAGLCVVIAIVSASRSPRLREMGILSSLGATRWTMIKIYTVEFAAIGLLSGAIGSALAYGFTGVTLAVIFHRVTAALEWRVVAGAIVISALTTIVAGWAPAYRLLGRKPMEVLRHE